MESLVSFNSLRFGRERRGDRDTSVGLRPYETSFEKENTMALRIGVKYVVFCPSLPEGRVHPTHSTPQVHLSALSLDFFGRISFQVGRLWDGIRSRRFDKPLLGRALNRQPLRRRSRIGNNDPWARSHVSTWVVMRRIGSSCRGVFNRREQGSGNHFRERIGCPSPQGATDGQSLSTCYVKTSWDQKKRKYRPSLRDHQGSRAKLIAPTWPGGGE